MTPDVDSAFASRVIRTEPDNVSAVPIADAINIFDVTVGRKLLERNTDGSFCLCSDYNWNVDKARITSETSSMKAEVGTVPYINSFSLQEGNCNSNTPAAAESCLLVPLDIAEKSLLFYGAGLWQSSQFDEVQTKTPIILPWRQDVVNLDDFNIDAAAGSEPYDTYETTSQSEARNPKRELIETHLSGPPFTPRWPQPRSHAGTAESTSELTSRSSWDTESVRLTEHPLEHDENVVPVEMPLRSKAGPLMTHDWTPWGKHCFDEVQTPGIVNPLGGFSRLNLDADLQLANPQDFAAKVPTDCDENEEDDVYCSTGDDSSDTESIWMSDYSEIIPFLDDDHPFLLAKPEVVQRALLAFQNWKQHTNDTGEGSVSCSTQNSAERANSGKESAKRSPSKRERNEDDEENDEKEAPKKRFRASKQFTGRQVSLACPFAKKDPLNYRGCCAYVIKRTQDVKQHLSRFHQPPIYCQRCKRIFDTDDQLHSHSVEIVGCQPQQGMGYDGITRTQKAQLGRRVSPKMTLENQWFTIFDILFPGHQPRPLSAYINTSLTIELESFQDMMFAHGPTIILDGLRTLGIPATTSTEESDLSTLLRSTISDCLQTIAQRWTAIQSPDPVNQQGTAHVGTIAGSHTSRQGTASYLSQASSDTAIEGLRYHHIGQPTGLEPLSEERGTEVIVGY